MINPTAENEPFFWASRCMEHLFLKGVRHIVISPGSRSTPLAIAAASHPILQKHVILDERSAAFFALGIGKATGIPAALTCTSGTAAANYFPAIIESSKSGVPLIALTADRPEHLRNTDANQTINQRHLYGDYPVYFRDVVKKGSTEKYIERLKKWTLEAVESAINRKGPAHLNFPFEKPFTPAPSFVRQISRNYQTKLPSSDISKNKFQFPAGVKEKLDQSQKPLVIVGQLAVEQSASTIFDFARKLNIPLLSEDGYSKNKQCIHGFDGFLRKEENRTVLQPDLILHFGRPPASKSLLIALESWKNIFSMGFHHPSKRDKSSLNLDKKIKWEGKYLDFETIQPKKPDWFEIWQQAETNFAKNKNQRLDKLETLTDGHIYEEFSSKIPPDYFLFFSNSFAARDRSLFGTFNQQKVFTNRGVSGIDGITSTAMGISKATGTPGVLFTGDLAFLHDTNALLNHTKIDHPLATIVINNNGGSIFRMLPIADQQDYFEPYFETPQSANIGKLVESYGIPFKKIDSITALKNFDFRGWIESYHDFSVIECQTDADISMELRNTLWDIDL